MEEFLRWNWPTPVVSELLTKACFWAGYAIFIGMTARAVVNLRLTKSPWLTLCIGIVSVTSGLFTLRSFFDVGETFDPVSPPAIAVALAFGIVTALMCKIAALLFPSEGDEYDDRYDDADEEYDLEQYDNSSTLYDRRNGGTRLQYEPTRRELERERQRNRNR